MNKILFVFLVLSTTPLITTAADLSLLTLNLHGYHPMGEDTRVIQYRNGRKVQANSNIFYFNKKELERGNLKRIEQLSKDLSSMNADIVAMQEVGAGHPDENKACEDFHKKYDQDFKWENTAIRINRRLESHKLYLACRGNIGWFTGESNFKNKRILDSKGNLIIDFDSNPYPHGVLIEGFAILVSERIKVLDHYSIHVPYNDQAAASFYK